MSFYLSGIFLGDIAGFLATIFISATALLMVAKRLLKFTKKQLLFKRIHIIFAVLGGGFLVMHVNFFIGAPFANPGIAIGYAATAVALLVWFSGFAFLDRLANSLLYHGSLSLAAVSLMLIHAAIVGFSFRTATSEIVLALVICILLVRASQHIVKIAKVRVP